MVYRRERTLGPSRRGSSQELSLTRGPELGDARRPNSAGDDRPHLRLPLPDLASAASRHRCPRAALCPA